MPKSSKSVNKRGNQYSTKQIIDRLREHMVDNALSYYTMTHPTYHTVFERIKGGDKKLEKAFNEIKALHWQIFERKLLDALFNGNEIDMQVFNAATRNKKPFLSYETLDVDARLEAIERVTNVNKKQT